jgi:hypothetical protein
MVITIDPGAAAAKKFGKYLEKHSEFEITKVAATPSIIFE